MLEEMRISGIGVIDDAVLEFGPRLSVVTGETGAGKTMVISGLSLLMGARADTGLVRTGADRATVEGRFRIDPRGAVAQRVAELGGDLDDDGTLLIARTVGADGRSRGYVGGRAAPVSVLAELAADLVAVHGQSDQLRLRRPAVQRDLLDAYAGPAIAEALPAYAAAYARRRELCTRLTEMSTKARERAQEANYLRFALEEIASVQPDPDEDGSLDAEIALLGHIDSLLAAAHSARAALLGDADIADPDGAVDAMALLTAARSALESCAEHDPDLAELARRVAESCFLIADAGTALASYADRLEPDPVRLEAAQERKADLAALTRKYDDGSGGLAGVLGWARQAADRLAEVDDSQDRQAALGAEIAELEATLSDRAVVISAARQQAGAALAQAIATELSALAMSTAEFAVAIRQVPADEESGDRLLVGDRWLAFGPAGVDDVEFLLAAHAGAPARPLQRAASGGELSRVMLALQVVLQGADPVPTFVFDEVDAGVGGRAAAELGQRLARLADSAQVIVVTHLPQVAAYADRHLLVEKAEMGAVTSSSVTAVDGSERVAELSRMLAGLADSDLARGHAEELLAAAAARRGERSD